MAFAISSRSLRRRPLRPIASAAMAPISEPASAPSSPKITIRFSGAGPVALVAGSSNCAEHVPDWALGEPR